MCVSCEDTIEKMCWLRKAKHMSQALLSTKLYIPSTRDEIVWRRRLAGKLEDGLSGQLTLVSAPAGFGKSTLVASWLSRPAAWLSLDKGDNDPARFWSYVVAAIQQIKPEIGQSAQEMLNSPKLRESEPAVISLVNDLTSISLILILDDYHVIDNPRIHNSLGFLLEHQPPQLHVILITRADPPLPLARLRAHGQLNEIRAYDLQFSTEETTNLFNTLLNFNLSASQVKILVQHTEGWIVGLQLAALSLKKQPSYDIFIEQFTGSHQFILSYLTEEVLNILPTAQRDFLLRTSILDSFCASLCQAVTGHVNAHEMLDTVRISNLFLISLEVHGQWFRYHHLFADLLRALLHRDYPDDVIALHEHAAEWYEQHGYISEAVQHALHTQKYSQVKALILRHWTAAAYRGEITTVLEWLDALPDNVKQDDLSLLLARCWILHLSGQTIAIAPYLERAIQLYEQAVSDTHDEPDLVFPQLSLLSSVLASSQGNYDEAVAYAEKAVETAPLDILPISGSAWNLLAAARISAGDIDGGIDAFGHGIKLAYAGGNLLSACVSTFGRAVYMMYQGQLEAAANSCQAILEQITRDELLDLPASGLLQIALAKIVLERDELDQAEAYLANGLRVARAGGFSEVLRYGRYIQAQLAAAQGNFDEAQAILREAEPIVMAMNDEYLVGELYREWTFLYLAMGEVAKAREMLDLLDKKRAIMPHPGLDIPYKWLTASCLIAETNYDEAFSWLEDAINQLTASNSRGELIRVLAMKAIVLESKAHYTAAHSTLRQALELGASQNYVRRWLDGGPRIAPLLTTFRNNDVASQEFSPYLDAILAACQAQFGHKVLQNSLLSEREVEVLRLISRGYSNKAIADELVVTLHTIKKHTSNIYGKLGVTSRTQAVARARELNLL